MRAATRIPAGSRPLIFALASEPPLIPLFLALLET